MKKTMVILCAMLFIFWVPGTVGATPLGPVYPPPGGVTWTPTPNVPNWSEYMGRSGGLFYNFSNFDSSAYSALYWGPESSNAVGISLNGPINQPGEILSFDGFSGNYAQWTGSSQFVWNQPVVGWTVTTLTTRFILRVWDFTDNPINFIDASSLGLGVGAVVPVSGDFKAQLYAGAISPYGSWWPVLDMFDYYGNYPSSYAAASFAGGFFYDEPIPAVPEPATMLLLSSGLLGLAGLKRRFRKK